MKTTHKDLNIKLMYTPDLKNKKWVVDNDYCGFDTKYNIYDMLLGLPFVTNWVIENKTEIEIPFSGESYKKHFQFRRRGNNSFFLY